jgi:uncharacterized protein YbaR (Trm112 family)
VGAAGAGCSRPWLWPMVAAAAWGSKEPMSALDPRLLEILVCPLCKGPLVYHKAQGELICKADRLGFPIKDDIPVMLEEEARKLPPEEEVA